MVDVWVVANVDGRTDIRTYERTNIRKTEPLYRAMPEAGATESFFFFFFFFFGGGGGGRKERGF